MRDSEERVRADRDLRDCMDGLRVKPCYLYAGRLILRAALRVLADECDLFAAGRSQRLAHFDRIFLPN